VISRRSTLKTMAAASFASIWDAPLRFAFARLATDRRLIVVVLRGALDGLAAVPPHGDADYASVRGSLALDRTGTNALHDLDGFFGLHPALINLKTMYDAKELALFQNICSPYRQRSHFEGQNVLETGADAPHVLQDGWLNRALVPLGLSDGMLAMAIAQSPPLILSGPAKATSWMPQVLPQPDAKFLADVEALYSSDVVLSASLRSALDLEAKARAAMDDVPRGGKGQGPGQAGGYGNLTPLFAGAGKLLAHEDGPRVAVFDASGWDTHFNEGTGDGQLARRLRMLDSALDSLKTSMGETWRKTAIVMATEFGRTVHPNGTGGTDHGTGGAAFLLGGAVAGGTVHAEWVGLKSQALQDGRDQPPRTDLRSLFKGVLSGHMGAGRSALDQIVFPDSANVPTLAGLIRA
jgi:uncharacterized protein (DUF1501 family)